MNSIEISLSKKQNGCHAEALEACGQRPLRSPFPSINSGQAYASG